MFDTVITLKESCDIGSYAYYSSPAGVILKAETFTPQTSYLLRRIELAVSRYSALPGILTISIRNVVNGLPGANIIASQTFDGDTLPIEQMVWANVVFANPIWLNANTPYALVVKAENYIRWYSTNADSFAGDACSSVDNGGNWTIPSANTDFQFKVYGSSAWIIPDNNNMGMGNNWDYQVDPFDPNDGDFSSSHVAYLVNATNDWTDYLEFTITDPVNPKSSKARIAVNSDDGGSSVLTQVDRYVGGVWTNIYEGSPAKDVVTELNFSSSANTTKYRVRFKSNGEQNVTFNLAEFQVNYIPPSTGQGRRRLFFFGRDKRPVVAG